MMKDASFAGKFLRKIKKIDTEQVEAFLGQLIREKAFLEVILDSIDEGVIVTEGDSEVVFINETAKYLLGLKRTKCEGKPLEDLLKIDALRDILDEFRDGNQQINKKEIIVPTSTQERIYSLSIVPIENDDSIATHAVWILNDRTEVARREDEKQRIERMESLAVLTAGIAHEIKNPLNSMNIHAQLSRKASDSVKEKLGDDPVGERLEKSTSVILEEIQRLKHIVDDFIRAVRPVNPQLRKYAINKTLISIAELVGPECNERGIELTLNLDEEISQVLIDPDQIYQALLNIIRNAIEAIEPEKQGIVTVRTYLKSDHILIEVEDNGEGIPEDKRLKIFEPYHTSKFTGTGLGLVLVYRIIKAHGGAIGLKSEVDVGTLFSVALPLEEKPVRMLPEAVEPTIENIQNSNNEE